MIFRRPCIRPCNFPAYFSKWLWWSSSTANKINVGTNSVTEQRLKQKWVNGKVCAVLFILKNKKSLAEKEALLSENCAGRRPRGMSYLMGEETKQTEEVMMVKISNNELV